MTTTPDAAMHATKSRALLGMRAPSLEMNCPPSAKCTLLAHLSLMGHDVTTRV